MTNAGALASLWLGVCVALLGCDKAPPNPGHAEPQREKATKAEPKRSDHLPSVPEARALTAGATVIELGYEQLRLDDETVASLEAGAFSTDAVDRHLVSALFEPLSGEPANGQVCRIEVDKRIPFSTLVDVLYTTGRAGYGQWEFVVDSPAPDRRALPLTSPKVPTFGEPMPPTGAVWIDKDGFRVLPPEGEETQVYKADTAADSWAAYDSSTLEKVLKMMRKRHPDVDILRISAEADTEFDLLAQTLSLALTEFDAIYLEAPG